MALICLWEGSPCQRPVRASVRYRSWTGRLAVRHAGIVVGKVAVPKTGQKPPSPRGDATDVLLLVVAVPKEGR